MLSIKYKYKYKYKLKTKLENEIIHCEIWKCVLLNGNVTFVRPQ